MDLKLKKTSDVKDRYLNILIFGFPGAGKTVFAGTAPDPLILDIEGGTLSLAGKDLMKVDIDNYEQVKYLYQVLRSPDAMKKAGFDYIPKTIVIDSGTELQKKIMDSVLENEKREFPQLRDWGIVQAQLRKVIRYFRELPFHFIITALVDESKDETSGVILNRPSFSGKASSEISGFMDLVLYLGVKRGKDEEEKRLCLTGETEKTYAKDRSGKLPKYIEPDFAKIYNAIYTKKEIK